MELQKNLYLQHKKITEVSLKAGILFKKHL